MNYILFDTPQSIEQLKPFTFTRPICEIRIGILTIREKWEKHLKTTCSYMTQDYLRAKYPLHTSDENILINAAVLPNEALIDAIKYLQIGECLRKDDVLIALKCKKEIDFKKVNDCLNVNFSFEHLKSLTDIFALNGSQMQADFQFLKQNQVSQSIEDKHTIIYNPENVFVEAGVKIKAAILNAENGVIYLGKNAQVSEGTIIQGNFALCEGAVINPAGKMRGDTTIGPYCKVGGEISNSVLFGYSNKAHDGFLGNSVLGEWCNLGADTNNSNLKNNYSNVKLWNYAFKDFEDTGRQFVGLMMGDHSKAGINTMFNTGTVIGVSSNIFGAGFPPKFVDSFQWGSSEGFEMYDFEKAMETAKNVMARRNIPLDEMERAILKQVFEMREG